MKNQIRTKLFTVFLIGFVSILIFWKFFIQNLYPFPGNFLLAWYEPWKSDYSVNGFITLGHKPVASDIFRQLYPFKVLAMDMIKRFEWPLWNPYNGAGMPLMATMHIGFLNPFNILFVFLSPELSWSIQVILQPLLIALTTYLYVRKLGRSIQASLFSTFSFLFCGFVIVRSIFNDYDFALISLPLLLYFIECFFQNTKTKKIFFIPPVVFFLIVSVQPQIIFYILCFVGVYMWYRFIQNKYISVYNFFLFLSMLGIGLGLSAVQLIPTYELYTQASINASSSKFIFEKFLLPPTHFISLVIPNYFGSQSTYNFWGTTDYIETIASIGTIPTLFAFLSLGKKNKDKKDIKKFFYGATVIPILLSINWFGTQTLYSIPIPIISTNIPSRILFLTSFSISILAGIGFDYIISLSQLDKKIKKLFFVYGLLIGSIFIGTGISYGYHFFCNNPIVTNCRSIALRNSIIELVIFISGTSCLGLYFLSKKHLIKKIALWSIIGLAVIIGLYNSNKYLPFSNKNTFLPTNNVIQTLQKTTQNARVFGVQDANLKTDFATQLRIYDPNYYDPLYIKRYGELIQFANNGIYNNLLRSDVEVISDRILPEEKNMRRNKLFDLLGVRYILMKKSQIPKSLQIIQQSIWQDNTWSLIENNVALPIMYTVNHYEVISDNKKLLSRLFSKKFNPLSTVLLEQKIPFESSNAKQKKGEITSLNRTENTVIVKTNTDQKKLLVVSDNYYPGWKAYIDNVETEIYRANYTFRSIILPKGEHTVSFVYQPFSLMLGIFCSFFFSLLYVGLFVWKKVRG